MRTINILLATTALLTAASAHATIISISPSDFNEGNVFAINGQSAETIFGTFDGGEIEFTGTNTENDFLSTQSGGQARFQGAFTGKGQATFDLTSLMFGSTSSTLFSTVEFRLQGLVGDATIILTDQFGEDFTFNTATLGGTGADRFAFQGIDNQSIASVSISATGGFDDLRQLRVGAAVAPVPEPATWAMLILGFGAVGGMMRRRSGAAVASRTRLTYS